MSEPRVDGAIELLPLGDRAWLVKFASDGEAAGWVEAVRAAGFEGVMETVLAYRDAAVFIDPDRVDPEQLAERLERLPWSPLSAGSGREHRLPVLYDGPDLQDVAGTLGVSIERVIAIHHGESYRVLAIGFLPGFPYAGMLPDALRGIPRRASPRTRVPAGSVAIAGSLTGVYPQDSPGGWHLLGRTPLRIVDLERAVFPIRAGDRIRFCPIDQREFERRRGEPLIEAGLEDSCRDGPID